MDESPLFDEPLVVRLEYSVDDGTFHYEETDKNNRNTWGWATVYPHVITEIADKFIDVIETKYPQMQDVVEDAVYPTLEQIRADFNEFCQQNGF